MQIFAIVVSLAITAVGVALFVKAIRHIIAVVRLGQPTASRTGNPRARTVTLLKESLGHTRMLQWTADGVGHWFVFIRVGLLFFTLLTAFGQLFDPHFALPLIGHFFLYEWITELITWAMLVAIAVALPRLGVDRERCAAALAGGILATDEVMRRVEGGTAFRTAYREVAAAIGRGEVFDELPPARILARRRSTGGLGDLGLRDAAVRLRRGRRGERRERKRFEGAMGRLAGRKRGG